jgi:hypothetical protein
LATTFPIDKLHRAGVVVWDLKKAVRDYTEVYGIADWRVVHHTPSRLRDASFAGRKVSHGYSSAVGTTPGGAITFELIQPGPGASSFKQFLYARGEGVHHLLLRAGNKADLRDLTDWLSGQGIGVAQSESIDGLVTTAYFDTRKSLGGYYLKAVATEGGDFDEAVGADETWNLTSEMQWPEGAPLKVPLLHHFGIVVRDVVERAESYSLLFGIDNWNFGLWHSAPGSLENATYNGKPVEHSYFTTLVSPVTNFGFELVQPALGPQNYKEDYLNVFGEGIHHLFTQPPPALRDLDHWKQVEGWMGSMGVPMVQSASLGGWADFYYLDTKQKLGGYITETMVVYGARPTPAATPADGEKPAEEPRELPPVQAGRNSRDFAIDFTAEVDEPIADSSGS